MVRVGIHATRPGRRRSTGTDEMGLFSWLFRRSPPKAAASLSRNAPCWCGSGKKYKRCHYEADRKHFAAQQQTSCSGST